MSEQQQQQPDLGYRDWLLFTQQRLFNSVDPMISTKIVDTPDGGKLLIAKGITESALENIAILTNTDQNNNYLYLESFYVYLFGYTEPLNIPGLFEVANNLYQDADLTNFINGSKIKKPFTGMNVRKNAQNQRVRSFADFVDQLTYILPCSPYTYTKIKTFEIVLRP